MRKELIISTIPQETRVAVLEDDEVVEFLIERHRAQGIAGNIYKGRVTKVLPGMQSAFVDIGLERDAFLYVSDFLEDMDEYDRIVSTAEDEAFKAGDSSRRASSSRTSRTSRAGRAAKTEKPKERPKERPGEADPGAEVSPGNEARDRASSSVESPAKEAGDGISETIGPEAKKKLSLKILRRKDLSPADLEQEALIEGVREGVLRGATGSRACRRTNPDPMKVVPGP